MIFTLDLRVTYLISKRDSAYSKLTSDELLLNNHSSSNKVNTTQITEDIQDLFDIC